MVRPAARFTPWFVVLALATSLLCAVPGPRAYAGTVPKSVCARYDDGVRTGLCLRDGHGGVYWLGTLKGYDGVEMYCIDYLFATRWGVPHRRVRVAGTLQTSLGGRVDAATRAALTYVVTRHPASAADDRTAAAIGLIIREVMGDVRRSSGRPIPGGLTAGREVRAPAFVPDAVVARARALWTEARSGRGPWTVQVKLARGQGGRVAPGERVTLAVLGRNGSHRPQDMAVSLGYTGFTGPAVVRLGRDGAATVTLTAPPSPQRATVVARVSAPGVEPVLVVPRRWQVNQHPGSPSPFSQRGLVGSQTSVVAADRVDVEVHYGPTVETRTSAASVVPGGALVDRVALTGADPAFVGPITATLHGPFPAPPGPADCVAGSVAGSVTFAVHGDGAYTSPTVTVPAVGYYTWVETLPAAANQDELRTPCGISSETTLATALPTITTRTSDTVVRVGGTISDHVRVTGTAPGYAARATAQLFGPFASREAARCTGKPYAEVSFRVSGDGDYTAPPVRLRAAGFYTWIESLPTDGLTRAVRTQCGLVAETTLAHRAPPVPQQPSVPAGGHGRIAR